MAPTLAAFAATFRDVAVFVFATLALGLACGPRRISDPLLRLCAGTSAAIGGTFFAAFLGFAFGLPSRLAAAAVLAAALGVIAARWRAARELADEPAVAEFFGLWVILAAWSLGLLALVESYSGGGWAADWVEHWQRTVFFADRQPLSTRFANIYTLTARPPLANTVIAGWLESGPVSFARFQVFMTLFGTLVLLPMAALARRWAAPKAGRWALLILMCSPLVAENLTFSWTKLPTAFFVLCGIALATAKWEPEQGFAERTAAAAALGLAVLTHYSAVPWVIAIAAGYAAAQRPAWRTARWWQETSIACAVFLAIVAVWVAWAAGHFGWAGTAGSTTTAGAWQVQTPAERLLVPLQNIWDTLVPFPLRGEPRDGLIQQASTLGRLRDVAFNLYQINLPLSVGLAGLWVLGRAAVQPRAGGARHAPAGRRFFATALPIAAFLGIVVHTPRDHWGLAHICLQPLTLLALAFAAARLSRASARELRLWAVLAVADAFLGLLLPFALETDRLVPLRDLSRAAWANAADKAAFGFRFFADVAALPPALTALWLALCAGAAIVLVRNRDPGGA